MSILYIWFLWGKSVLFQLAELIGIGTKSLLLFFIDFLIPKKEIIYLLICNVGSLLVKGMYRMLPVFHTMFLYVSRYSWLYSNISRK